MGLEPGSTIGPYVIDREIGRGGMGVVYLARDPRLDRDVAVKALPDHLAEDAGRLERFEGEARTLAQLSHPAVAGIHGLEEKDGQRFLILEYVEGESLADRLERGTPSVEEALEIGVKIAAGVEAAHDTGVIHRDLKPENVRITPDGDVKVLDFGLAKIDDGSASISDGGSTHAPTMARRAGHSPTLPGVILGTAAYMSPEQARGRRVDKRTDIWSFGVLLYECLTGTGPFVGESVSDSIGAILHKDVDMSRLPPGTPGMVRHLLRGCLERDRARRYRDIGDVRIELERALGEPEAEEAVRPSATPPVATLPMLGLAIGLALVAGAAVWFLKPAQPPLPVVHSEIPLPEGRRAAHSFHAGLAISPDGQTLALVTGDELDEDEARRRLEPSEIMLRRLDQPEMVPLVHLEDRATAPTFSPDGQWIAYAGPDALYRVSVTGGQPQKLCDTSGTVGLAWGDDGSIIVGQRVGELLRVPATGGDIEPLTELDTEAVELSHRLPHFLPGARAVLFTVHRFGVQATAPDAWSVWALDLGTGERRAVIAPASHPQYVKGSLTFMREGALMAVPFDVKRLETTGPPRVMVDGVQHSIYAPNPAMGTSAGQFAVSQTGTLVYAPGSVFPETPQSVVLVDRRGNETPLEVEPRQYMGLRGSPDGRRLLMPVHYAPSSSVWIHDLDRGLSRLQVSEETDFATWGPGPDHITYARTFDDGRRRLLVRPIGGQEGDESEIEQPDERFVQPSDWSPDGRHLFATRWNGSQYDVCVYTVGDGWAALTEAGSVEEMWPAVSPDGRWLAYSSNESGRMELLVRPFPGPGPTVQVSHTGGTRPVWSRDGSELFYRGRDAEGQRWVFAVAVAEVDGKIDPGRPVPLFEDVYAADYPIRSWDVLGDRGFVLKRGSDADEHRERVLDLHTDRLRIVQNWASLLD